MALQSGTSCNNCSSDFNSVGFPSVTAAADLSATLKVLGNQSLLLYKSRGTQLAISYDGLFPTGERLRFP